MATGDYDTIFKYIMIISLVSFGIKLIIFIISEIRHLIREDASSLPPSSQPKRLDAAMITTYHQTPTEMNESLECTICLEIFKEGEKVKVLLSCCHCYHCECIDKWLIKNSSCPMCRSSVNVPVDSPV